MNTYLMRKLHVFVSAFLWVLCWWALVYASAFLANIDSVTQTRIQQIGRWNTIFHLAAFTDIFFTLKLPHSRFFFRHFFYYSFFFLMKLIILLLMNMNTWIIKTSKNKHNKIAKNGRNNYSLLENTGPCGFWIIAFPIFIIYFYSLSFVFIHLTKFDSRPTFAFLFFEQVQMVAIIKYVLLPFCRE